MAKLKRKLFSSGCTVNESPQGYNKLITRETDWNCTINGILCKANMLNK